MTAATETKKTAKTADVTPHASGASPSVVTLSGLMRSSGELKDKKFDLESDFVANNLPEDVTPAMIKRVEAVRKEFIAAGALALADVAGPAMKKDKKLDSVELGFKFGNDRIDVAYDREREFSDGKGGRLKKFGHLSVGFTAAGSTPSGDLGKIRKHAASEATEMFGS